MGPKRYRAGVPLEPDSTLDGTGNQEMGGNNVFQMRGEAGSAGKKTKGGGRMVVQAQILTDGGAAFGKKFETVESQDGVRKPDAAHLVVENREGMKKNEKEESSSGSDSDSDSDSDDSDSSDSDDAAPPAQVAFVPKSKRVDTAAKAEVKARHEMAQQVKEKKERQKRSREMASESVARKVAEKEGPGSEDEEGYPDDTDGKDDQKDYLEWKTREILRLNRDEKK